MTTATITITLTKEQILSAIQALPSEEQKEIAQTILGKKLPILRFEDQQADEEYVALYRDIVQDLLHDSAS